MTIFNFSLVILSITNIQAALSLQTYIPEKHDRYANNTNFIGQNYNFSGVGIETGSRARWATMISSTHFITATHATPSIGANIVFHTNNNPNGPTISRKIVGTTVIYKDGVKN